MVEYISRNSLQKRKFFNTMLTYLRGYNEQRCRNSLQKRKFFNRKLFLTTAVIAVMTGRNSLQKRKFFNKLQQKI